ncbi:helix-turn-helix domain-containing protein [Amycolatopsis sp. YIM 10]|uniref:helix-turn-helix domain-containing protein n=1 Tax=Amycolatopsis sp. YIM 10 TaxID=2653857 RepID=UPI00129035B4|nr:helix-turn-helix transcriptional regulator [Amycolatopsis sp. YIM 10]QFU87841.1 Helix-turn-helix protein [Amycolatopsis sp. YIM 10]QFU94846.1 Helix-turn-helix protein [Amycolatopsis sp. YIM 10]
MSIGHRITKLRAAANLSQVQLAEAMQARGHTRYHQSTVHKIESGGRFVRADELAALAQCLRCSVLDILGIRREDDAAWRRRT